MAYCEQGDVENAAGGPDRLVQLVDYDADGNPDADELADAIAAAGTLIDSYAQRKYRVPLDPVPEVVRIKCAREVVYQLRDAKDILTDRDVARHDELLQWLQDLARGIASLGTSPDGATSSEILDEAGGRDEADETITRDSLKGVW